jgi:hypothetical protein
MTARRIVSTYDGRAERSAREANENASSIHDHLSKELTPCVAVEHFTYAK